MEDTDSYECPQCKDRRETYDCAWCNNTGRIPLRNVPNNPDWKPNAPHSFYSFAGNICECLRFKEHPLHGGTQWAEAETPVMSG